METQVVKRGNGWGVAGFILSLFALIVCWLPFISVWPWFAGLVCSIVGVCRKQRKKGLAITGLVISLLGVILLILLAFVFAAVDFL